MNCEGFAKVVHEVAREDTRAGRKTLSAAEAISARFHAETCEACAARLNEARAVVSGLKIIAENATNNEARPYVEMAVLDAFREHQRMQERVQCRRGRARLRWAEWITVSAAAAVLLAVGAWKFSHWHAAGMGPRVSSVMASNVNAGAEQAADSQARAAQDSDFVPLPYGEDFSADDAGVVVRVSMSRSALESLGYPVAEGNSQDVVQADLIVGEDGWPRAVRLVQ